MDAEEVEKSTKGKAVHVLHVFRDNLWEMGSKSDPPVSLVTSSMSKLVDETNEVGEAEMASDSPDKDDSLPRTVESAPPHGSLSSTPLPETTPQGWSS